MYKMHKGTSLLLESSRFESIFFFKERWNNSVLPNAQRRGWRFSSTIKSHYGLSGLNGQEPLRCPLGRSLNPSTSKANVIEPIIQTIIGTNIMLLLLFFFVESGFNRE